MIHVQLVLLLYGLSGGENWPLTPVKYLLHLPGVKVKFWTFLAGRLLTESFGERRPNDYISTTHGYILHYD